MMTKAQSLDQYLWFVMKWWPRINKALHHGMKEDIEKQLKKKAEKMGGHRARFQDHEVHF